jgi:DNA-binding NarL/FixJ family response regulator
MPEISKPLQVYVVEDSPIVRRLLASTVEAAGAQLIGQSASADGAVADLSVLNPDLILVDIGLSSGSGFDVLRALQDRHFAPTAIKVVFTNHTEHRNEELSLSLGADRFFDKSVDTPQVLALISALAKESRHKATALRNANQHHPSKRSAH